MKKFYPLIFIILLTAVAILVDMPDGRPVKFNFGPLKVDRVTKSPHLLLPALSVDRQIKTQLGLDLLGGTQLTLEVDMKDIPGEQRLTALESAKEIIERRVNFFGVSEPTVQTAQLDQSYRILVELPGIQDIGQAVDTIGATAQLEFRELSDPQSTEAAYFPTLENTKETGLTGKDLKKAELAFDPTTGEPLVAFEMTAEGGQKFGELTTRLVGQPLPIFLDEFPLSAPVVRTPITEGSGSITGGFTREGAKQLALQLSAGALPAPINIIEQKNIGATLGASSVQKSITAGMVGLALVGLFMITYYGWLGVIADSALIIYGLLTYALFRLVPVTLTLPGIAGFILSIGMAVDANILIFERYKEEIRGGKSWQIAMELGFGRAWDSIRDANFTTLITAFILYNPLNWSFLPTSGMVRGFALTLAIGVLTSLFTGIVVTRNFMRVFYRPKKALSVRGKS